MENNILKENYLDIMQEKDIITVQNKNALPATVTNNSMLLPVVIKNEEQSLVAVQKEIEKIKNHKVAKIILKILKSICVLCAKLVRFCFLFITGLICFLGVSVIVVMSTAIITRNIINSNCDIVDTDISDSSFSIFVTKNT